MRLEKLCIIIKSHFIAIPENKNKNRNAKQKICEIENEILENVAN